MNHLSKLERKKIEAATHRAHVALAEAFGHLGLNASVSFLLAEKFTQEAVGHIGEKLAPITDEI